jgi:hypothetical protein
VKSWRGATTGSRLFFMLLYTEASCEKRRPRRKWRRSERWLLGRRRAARQAAGCRAEPSSDPNANDDRRPCCPGPSLTLTAPGCPYHAGLLLPPAKISPGLREVEEGQTSPYRPVADPPPAARDEPCPLAAPPCACRPRDTFGCGLARRRDRRRLSCPSFPHVKDGKAVPFSLLTSMPARRRRP